MKVQFRLWLDHDRDSDIISYLDGMSEIKRGSFLRALIREHVETYGEETIMAKLDRIERLLSSANSTPRFSATYPMPDVTYNDEIIGDNIIDDDVLSNLDNLGV